MSESRKSAVPSDAPPASQTVRARIAEALRGAELTARELSQAVSVSEREVADHLEHLARSLAHEPERLTALAPHCISCGFSFADREKLKRPSRCPRCKSERISPARFAIRKPK